MSFIVMLENLWIISKKLRNTKQHHCTQQYFYNIIKMNNDLASNNKFKLDNKLKLDRSIWITLCESKDIL